ncbi:MAG: hypothetical protein EPN47_12225 [Acidobacteria bacterium]|nr:MAG: hypothetical protein EPN47_12225 [Acidobacteriota bacterium]
MYRKVTKLWLRVSVPLLAACLSGAVITQAAEKPAQPGDVSEVPAKRIKHGQHAKSKERGHMVVKAGQKEQAGSADEIAQLKKQLVLQQEQITQLLQAMNKLQEQVAATANPSKDISIPQSSGNAVASATHAAPQFPSAGEVASLSPVIPGDSVAVESGSASKLASRILPSASNAPQPVPAQAEKHEKLGPIATQDIKLGTTFYGSFSHYGDTGYAPAFQDSPTTQLGPGNSGLNTFEVNRAYINFYYTPNEHVTLRITPDIYRQSDNSYAFRLKYAYVDFQKIFGKGAFKDDKITFGQTTEPLVDWEEALSGYRYTYLVPWNYLSLSSTYSGARLRGPIEFNGKEYLDYDLGVFNTASFHSLETNDKKQVMGRLTVYPFGTTVDRTGLGFTAFEDYGYNTKLPSQVSTPLNRLSLLAHYQSHDKAYQIAFEYQLGRNATSTGNMFSGVGPAAGSLFSTLAGTALAGTHTRQQGFNVFGHARLGHSPFSLWGFYQNFQPNTNFQPSSVGLTDNPLDFRRTVGGIAYKVTDHFDVAFGDQNFHWVHPQGRTGPDTNGIVVWTQFNY